jgi:hypothetical protein
MQAPQLTTDFNTKNGNIPWIFGAVPHD